MLIHQPRWLVAYNDSSFEVPAHELVEITGGTYDTADANTCNVVLKVDRPSDDSLSQFAVNSWMPIPAGNSGLVTFDGPVIVYSSAALTIGETFGTGTDQFSADSAQSGMVVLASFGDSKYLCEFTKGTGAAGTAVWCFSLNEDMGATTAGEADADLLDLDFVDTTDDVTVEDPTSLFASLTSGDYGICIKQGTRYIILQANC